MLEALSQENRARTFLLLAAVAAFAVVVAAVGINDNPVGILFTMLCAASLVLSFAHPWRASAKFRRLTYTSLLALVVFVVLGIALQVSVDLTGMPRLVDQMLGVIGTAFLLGASFLCLPGILVGLGGMVVMRNRERKQA